MPTIENYEDKPKVFIGRGNNSEIVKSLIKKRFWWTVSNDPLESQFVWTQNKMTSYHSKMTKSTF